MSLYDETFLSGLWVFLFGIPALGQYRLLCFYIVDYFISKHPFFPIKETFKIIIKCHHALKVLKKCNTEKELMMFPQLRRYGKALDWYQWLTPQLLSIYCHCSLYYSKPSYILKTSIPWGWGLCPLLFGLCFQSLVHRHLNVECNLFFKSLTKHAPLPFFRVRLT